ncbi:MAG TPA: MlaD family protein [Chlamydiales bacterium]|nr:MlaD family protein [Chlamydiales bacterium]
MPSKFKTFIIGIFVIGAIISVVGMIIFLEPKIGDGKEKIHVRFTDLSGVNIGTRVLLAGRAVGEVIKITEIKDARKEPTDELGRVYFYEVTLQLDSSVQVFNTDEVTIQTTGLLGEKTIGIIPKAPKKGIKPIRIKNQILYGNAIAPLEYAVHQINDVTEEIEDFTKNVNVWFVENESNLSKAVESFSSTMSETSIAFKNFNEKNIIDSVATSIDLFKQNMQLVHQSLTEIQDDDVVNKLNQIISNFVPVSETLQIDGCQFMQNINAISSDISNGQGTLGKLIKEDDMYLRFVAILSKVDTLMNDINHYGLLFQYDKKWQRIRTKRANLLQALNSPKEFKGYFENEVDQVTTSLARISILLEKAECEKEKEKIMESIPFKRDFKTLLIKVESLLDSLKLYNEELVETSCD